LVHHVKTYQLQEKELDFPAKGAGSSMRPSESSKNSENYQPTLFPAGLSGKTSWEPLTQTEEQTFKPFSTKWETSGRISSNGQCWTHRITESPSGGGASFSSLASILLPLENVPTRYYLSAKAARGILRRSEARGKPLPPELRMSLEALSSSTADD
jgi:hypothetical protein